MCFVEDLDRAQRLVSIELCEWNIFWQFLNHFSFNCHTVYIHRGAFSAHLTVSKNFWTSPVLKIAMKGVGIEKREVFYLWKTVWWPQLSQTLRETTDTILYKTRSWKQLLKWFWWNMGEMKGSHKHVTYRVKESCWLGYSIVVLVMKLNIR